ncbi:MAG: hypothetical protein OM95_09940 [Bdellovibrio sp. ArHS]|uniref:hypothetical protein n=1 Tax=Bdellovibrio sp. ArHS TaxID=1569284 RepID=UPI000583AF2F|nr:hypothetical protein [Bdellovibrio sp. ArHS]KHD88225.1 MAG: hypothetical protein OM95_09940 [Bdellovibrio sp. ArHS]
MRNLIVAIAGFMLPSLGFAWWVPQMQFQVTPQWAAVQVYNYTGVNAFCQGQVFGLTQTGVWMNSWFQVWVPAGGFQYAYVYANGPYYFVNATANVQCQ